MIGGLLSASRHVRRHAFDKLPLDRDAAYAARELLAFDEDASVRARAASFLGRVHPEIAVPALVDALDDEAPLVRHAAVRALASARSGDAAAARDADGAVRARVERLAVEDPTWWVRRAAVVTVAALFSPREKETVGASNAIQTLRDALDDPFWRVRAAAVRALVALGMGPGDLLERLGAATSDRSSGALSYIARRLGAGGGAPAAASGEAPRAPGEPDPDPAVATARIARGDAVAAAFLVECLGDPHESLRVTARRRLARARDVRALELALLWLDEPRIPHAAQTVITLLDGLDRATVDPLLDAAFARGGAGALCWAASYVGLGRDASREDALLRHVASALPHQGAVVRCAVIAALAELGAAGAGDGRAKAAILAALDDPHPLVVRAAAQGALALGLLAELARVDAPSDAATRRVLALAAVGRGDDAALARAAGDPDVRVRAIAVRAMGEVARDRFAGDPDPWIRAAALGASSAVEALASDPHPWVRRAAFRLVRAQDPSRAGELAARSSDPWLLTRACAVLDPGVADHLVALLRLSRAASPGVRAAAAERLLSVANDAKREGFLDDALDALLADPGRREASDDADGAALAAVRIAAHTFRARRFEDADLDRLAAARGDEPEAVRAWIDDVRGVTLPREPKATEAVSPGRPDLTATAAWSQRRALGSTGQSVSALAISGAGLLPAHAYARALGAGCNLFFWEPRYDTLGRVLARERTAGVIAGTYEASERAIVADVERTLRRLRRDAIDVFLLFWARSPARLDAEAFDRLERLKRAGKIRAFGFSTHDRALACDALARPWDVVMIRHSAAHPGAESHLLPLAQTRGVGVIGFSALSYGRVISGTVTASDAYRYALSQPGMSTCLSAPRTLAELDENLGVLRAPPLSEARQAELRAHGARIREESRDFGASIRRHPVGLSSLDGSDGQGAPDLSRWLDAEDALDPRFG